MKKRSPTAPTGNAGITAVRSYCDQHNLIFQAEPREDFGIDCYVEVEFPPFPQNFLVGMQVKAGPSHRYDRLDGTFSVNVSQSDVSYWLAANYPVLFVYLHEQSNSLYFKHVQAVFENAQSLAQCTSMLFTDKDRAEPGRLAEYVRDLRRATPSIVDRFQVFKGAAAIKIGPNVAPLGISLAHEDILTFDDFHLSSLAQAWTAFPRWQTVLGYSPNGRWVCELKVTDLGPRGGVDVEVVFMDLDSHSNVQVPLLKWADLERAHSDEGRFLEQYCQTLDRLNQLASFLGLQRAQLLYEAYDLLYETEKRQPVHLCLGDAKFELLVGAYQGRDVLLLRADKYQPPRVAPLLVERVPPAFLLLPEKAGSWTEEDFMAIMRPNRFEYVAGVAVSPGGNRLTFAVMTTDSHPCWGSRTVHLAHFSLQELRQACSGALRA